jgi:hypothetical protein
MLRMAAWHIFRETWVGPCSKVVIGPISDVRSPRSVCKRKIENDNDDLCRMIDFSVIKKISSRQLGRLWNFKFSWRSNHGKHFAPVLDISDWANVLFHTRCQLPALFPFSYR